MCGRYLLSYDLEDLIKILQEKYEIRKPNIDYYEPRYNIAPSQPVLSIINDGKNNRVGNLHWGFVPYWAKDKKIGYKLINARSETLNKKPAFKHSFKNKRCIILSNGFYEWKSEGSKKSPYLIQLKNKSILPFAGLWSSYQNDDGTKFFSCTIITTTPNKLIEPIHNRMPVILDSKSEKIWLNKNISDTNLLSTYLKPYSSDKMHSYKVSTLVNNSRIDCKECIKPYIHS